MESEKVIDVGFGGGLPLLPLAYEAPQRLFFGLEARRKKAEAVKAIASKMGISNVNISHGRIEDSHLTEKTVLLFRAVGKIEDCLKGLKHPVTCFFYKGPSYWEKTERIPKGWKIIFQEKISVPQTQGRLILGLQKARAMASASRPWRR